MKSIAFRDKVKKILYSKKKEDISERDIIIYNIIAAFVIRGLSLVLSFFTLPIYIKFFGDKTVLGVWFTILSVMNWVTYFDLGLGNGLRNSLPDLIKNNRSRIREYISSTYFAILVISLLGVIVCLLGSKLIDWNSLAFRTGLSISPLAFRTACIIVLIGILVQLVFKTISSILYAIQLSAIVNLLVFISTLITLILVLLSENGSPDENLIRMAIINSVSINIPYVVASIIVFGTKLKEYTPSIHHVNTECIKEVLGSGLILLWLMGVYMVIANTNEFLISILCGSERVVEYQVYNKIFGLISSAFSLALSPIWSAVTNAAAQKEYYWIRQTKRKLLYGTFILLLLELFVSFFLQKIVNVWLGKNYIIIEIPIVMTFILSSGAFYLHAVNTSFGNGMSFFRVQLIWMTYAAVVDIPLAILLVKSLGWRGIVLANVIAMLPYETIEVFKFDRYVTRLIGTRNVG